MVGKSQVCYVTVESLNDGKMDEPTITCLYGIHDYFWI